MTRLFDRAFDGASAVRISCAPLGAVPVPGDIPNASPRSASGLDRQAYRV